MTRTTPAFLSASSNFSFSNSPKVLLMIILNKIPRPSLIDRGTGVPPTKIESWIWGQRWKGCKGYVSNVVIVPSFQVLRLSVQTRGWGPPCTIKHLSFAKGLKVGFSELVNVPNPPFEHHVIIGEQLIIFSPSMIVKKFATLFVNPLISNQKDYTKDHSCDQ